MSGPDQLTARPAPPHRGPGRRLDASLLFSFFAVAVCYAAALATILGSDSTRTEFFNADVFYHPALFQDLFVDHFSLGGWIFSAASFLVPDAVVYFVLNAIVRNAGVALCLYGLVQLLAIVTTCVWIARSSRLDEGQLAAGASASVLGFAALVMGGVLSRDPTWQLPTLRFLFLPVHHIGAFVMTLAGIGWTIRFIRSPRSAWESAAAFTLLAAAVMSDRLLIAEFVLPAGVVWLVSRQRGRAARAIAVLAGGAGIGSIASTWFERIPDQALTGIGNASAIYESSTRLLADLTASDAGAFLVLRVIWLAAMAAALVRSALVLRRSEGAADLRWVPAVFVLTMPLAVTAGVLSKGMYHNITTMHYFVGAWLLPLLMLPIVLLPTSPIGTRRPSIVAATALVPILLAFWATDGHAWRLPRSTTTPLVQCLDSIAAFYDLRFGIADYWRAKPATYLSRRGLRVYAVEPDLAPRAWISNDNWIRGEPGSRYPDPQYSFVVIPTLDSNAILTRFGEPAARISCGEDEVWIYNRSSDQAFHRLFRVP